MSSDSDNDYYYDDEDMMDEDDAYSDSVSEMDMDNEDFKIPVKEKKKSYEVDYKSLSQDAVVKLMNAELEHISGIFGVERDVAALLLRHLSWNKERLIEKYMDHANAVSVAAGVSLPDPDPPATSSSTSSSNSSNTARRSTRSSTKTKVSTGSTLSSSSGTAGSRRSVKKAESPPAETFVCQICFDDDPTLTTRALDCTHSFCTPCWTAYLSSKIRDEQEHTIRCMAEHCTLVAPDAFIRSLLVKDTSASKLAGGDAEQKEDVENQLTWDRFWELTIRDFVGANSTLKYCPYPSCTNTVSCPSASSKHSLTSTVPIVSCGARGIPILSPSSSSSSGVSGGNDDAPKRKGDKEHIYCFGCPIESDHRPLVCEVARMWMKKCRDDSETANWIKSNTKECPLCHSTIEKNGGCNHMTCKKCKHEFCWVCMGPWSEHGTQWYSCNRYEEKAGIDARDAQSKSRAFLERYLHYYNRWANHEQSAKLSVDLYAKTEKKMEDIQISSSLTWIEVQFMKKAVDEAVRCRRTLQWTYAMGYFLRSGSVKELFEANQRDLEKAVEDLSELLETPIEQEAIPVLRQKVTDKTVYVQMRNEVVLDDTATGLLEGRWQWNVPVEGFDDPDPADD